MHTQRLALAAAASLLSACCCIPLPSEQTVVPALVVHVFDGTNGLPEVDLTLVRYEYHPHFRTDNARHTASRTGPDGSFVFVEQVEDETIMPFMMHGVPGYGWQVCAQAPGYRSVAHGVPDGVDGTVPELRITLEPGDGSPCSELLGQSRLQPGESLPAD